MEYSRLTIGGLLRNAADRFPNEPAVTFGEFALDYSALLRESIGIAKGLIASGVKKGEHVGIWCTDRPKTLVSLYACSFAGAVAVMLGTSLADDEIASLVQRMDVSVLLYGDGYRDVAFPPIASTLPACAPLLRECVYIGEEDGAYLPDYAALMKRGEAVSDAEFSEREKSVSCDDTACILFTSGTGGASKGVMTSHFSRVNSAIFQARDLGASERDRFCIAIPMFHCFCLSASVIAAAACGGCVCFPESRHTADILGTIVRWKCTVMHAVPTLFNAIIARKDLAQFDLSSLRIGLIGGSACPPEQIVRIRETLGYNILPSLGLTEATAGITVGSTNDPIDAITETVGHFMDGVEGRIAEIGSGPNYKWLGTGETGEICVRGYNVMQGYYKQPELTCETIDSEGFLHTGDVGFVDERGNLHLTGRLKELIIRGGENIAPGEVETVLSSDPRVDTVKVVGVPDSHYGEEVCACIVLREGSAMTAEDARTLAADKLAYFKVPKYVLFFDELPLTSSGKIRSGELKKLAAQRVAEN